MNETNHARSRLIKACQPPSVNLSGAAIAVSGLSYVGLQSP